jgi:small basic protein (TIGR04137 family)
MSLHRSLKTKPAALNQHRNVLTRTERVQHLKDLGAFDPEEDSPLGLLKVANRKATTGKKTKKKEEEETAEVAGEEKAEA